MSKAVNTGDWNCRKRVNALSASGWRQILAQGDDDADDGSDDGGDHFRGFSKSFRFFYFLFYFPDTCM